MNKLEIAKKVTLFTVGAGVSTIVGSIIEKNVTTDNPVQKVLVFAGKTGISMLVGSAVQEHVGVKFDEAAAWVATNISK